MTDLQKCPYCPCRVGECSGCKVEEDDIGMDHEPEDRSCVLGVACLAVDPMHGPDECVNVEMMEAYYAEVEAGDG